MKIFNCFRFDPAMLTHSYLSHTIPFGLTNQRILRLTQLKIKARYYVKIMFFLSHNNYNVYYSNTQHIKLYHNKVIAR